MKHKIEKALQLLSHEVKNCSLANNYLFLGVGALANSLLLYKAGKYFSKTEYITSAIEEFEKAYDTVSPSAMVKDMGLITGYAGVGWIYQYFTACDLLDYDNDFFDVFDEVLLKHIQMEASVNNYDLFYGFLGYGCYFIQRHRNGSATALIALNNIVDQLEAMSIEDGYGIAWIEKQDDGSQNVNFGMAHGIPAIITFLAKTYLLTQNEKAKLLAEKAVNWLLHYEDVSDKETSRFPNIVNWNDRQDISRRSRLGWCYGDLGIGYSIYFCSKAFQNELIGSRALDILINTTSRQLDNTYTGVVDKSFCHGTSGIFYIYHLLVKSFGLTKFENARNYWLEKTIEDYQNINSFFSKSVYNNEKIDVPDPGLINGYVGIGLALAGYLDDADNEWHELFML